MDDMHPGAKHLLIFPMYPARNHTTIMNTITVHIEFLEILQAFFKLHRKMLNIQKYDFDEIL
jgi:hypothetical protein